MPGFFISRPIFAWVVALFICLAGIVSLAQLPVAQYPTVAPPSINITATYPGASAATLDETVVSLIESEMNGASGMLYMESVSQVNGQAEVKVTFTPETDAALAQVDVQNRLARAAPRLPQAVNQQGIKVEKSNANILMVVTLASSSGAYDRFELGDYMTRNILPELQRAPGVGQVRVFGAERAMRIWLDMDKLVGLGMTPADVNAAIKAQNAQVTSGIVGALPSTEGQTIAATLAVDGQLKTPEAFAGIVLRARADGSSVRLGDVARIAIGGQDYAVSARRSGDPIIGIAIQPAPGSNAVETSREVRKRLAELEQYFPAGMEYGIPIDSSKFIKISIQKVVETLLEAMLLVFIVMFVFLQSIRYTFIPAIVVPVALLGTFSVLYALGMSINVLTMFAMVLAIGILVDDAIVVVENVERIMAEEGLSPRQATRKAMGQITGAIVGITVVLVSVFIPMAFFGGSVGNIYRQFSLTMAVAILFSAFLAMSLTPALCATLLKPVAAGSHLQRPGFFGAFNRLFKRSSQRYESLVARILARTGRFLLIYAAIIAVMAVLLVRLPTSFLPDEDQGRIFTLTQLPPGATVARTVEVAKEIEAFYSAQPEVADVISIVGANFVGAGQNMLNTFVSLKDWSERDGEEHSAAALAKRAFGELMKIRDAISVPINPPPIPELGNGTGFSLRLQDRGQLGHEALLAARNQLLELAGKEPQLTGMRVEGVEDAPQLHLDIDRDQAYALGVGFDDINSVLSVALGSSYVNDFPNKGRMQRVIVQAEATQRMQPADLLKLQVRNREGNMVPLAAFASTRWVTGAMQLVRYNGYPAYRISGTAAPGHSTGEAMAAMERILAQMSDGIGYEWTGISREERLSGSQMPLLLGLSVLAVFLCLAALYESWSIPFSVMLVVPLGVLGSLLGATLLNMPNDVYFKVGLIAIIGLSAKNAILIIEFARAQQMAGKPLLDAVLLACHQRFRPILMTSMAFILGVLPLAVATGAGSAGQRAIGTGVMGGMITATVLAIFLVPVFYVVVRRLFPGRAAPVEGDA